LQFEASLGKLFLRLYLEKNQSQKRAGGVAQCVGPEFKPWYCKKKKKKTNQTKPHSSSPEQWIT
jgi:hypothetical protein